ncbi:MAG: hypothetical protein NC034_04425, partial [Ruminococcus sp.]|nr:hypothetical protein [Ruminococcus sp.]
AKLLAVGRSARGEPLRKQSRGLFLGEGTPCNVYMFISCLDARNEPKKIKLLLRHSLRCESQKRKIIIVFIVGDCKL